MVRMNKWTGPRNACGYWILDSVPGHLRRLGDTGSGYALVARAGGLAVFSVYRIHNHLPETLRP